MSSLTLTMLIQLILDAGFGIGITKNVLSAHQVGLIMLQEYVFQFLINAKLMPKMEIVPTATKDMT